jgi:hypothetical protein
LIERRGVGCGFMPPELVKTLLESGSERELLAL